MDSEKIKVLIVDDHPIVSEGLRFLLEKKDHFQVVASFTNGDDTLSYLSINNVDIILLDISLVDTNGTTLCLEIKNKYPDTKILAISNHNERSIIMEMLQNGASGYLLKNSSIDELSNSISLALQGKLALNEEVKSIIAKTSESFQKVPRLTRREKEVLKLVAEGLTTEKIARQLFISPLTVETHRRNLMQKFEVKNTAALIKRGMEHKLI